MKPITQLNRLIFYFSFAFFFLMSSCKNLIKDSPLSLVIPDEAAMVISIDILNLAKKANIEELMEMKEFQKMERDFFRKLGPDGEDLLELFAKPNKSGISIRQNPLFFGYNKGGSSILGFVFALKDSEKFKKEIEDWADDDSEDEETYAYIIKDQEIIGWNKNTAISIYGKDLDSKREMRRQLDRLFDQEKDESLHANKNFNDFLDESYDLGIWIDSNEGKGFAKKINNDRLYDGLYFDNENYFEDNFFHGYLNFQNDKLKITGNYFLNEDIQYLQNQFFGESLNTDHIKYIPAANLIGVCGISLNVKNLLDEFEDSRDGEKAIQELSDNVGLTKRRLKKLIHGDATLAITGFGETRHTLASSPFRSYGRSKILLKNNPEFVIIADVNEEDFIRVVQIAASEINRKRYGRWESLKIVDDYYVLTAPNFVELYFILENDRLILSNSLPTLKSIGREPLPASEQVDIALQKQLSEGVFSAFINMDIYDYPDVLLEQIRLNMGRTEFNNFRKSMSLFDHLIMKSRKDGIEIELSLDSKEDNSLFALLKFIGEMN